VKIQTESGIVVGNVEKKYGATNPIAKHLMLGFLSSVDELISQSGARSIHEVGCGEGHLTRHIKAQGYDIRASDFSTTIVEQAIAEHADAGIDFAVRSIYELKPGEDSAELIVCCEVMEHLYEPEKAVEVLSTVVTEWCLLSVPREPVWRALNMCRGKYLGAWGNTPGHVQHWSAKKFVSFIGSRFDVVTVRSPLPWTVVLCRAR
jgi:2-polyprenyl-3-methyl-5-hydroxy-6-metoxy-1,4-benzoquinol methylase